jgi:Fe-S cluster biogenesis protein NfuA/nitrite reductase/ring-hydroxylating ferredoxin subunit
MNDLEAREQVARVDSLLAEVEGFADERARETATELVAALLDLYGEAFARLLERVEDPSVAEDELISHLLMLHGMHPVPIEARVREALAEVRPYLDSHGGDVELIAIDDGVVRLRMQGSCSGCPSSAMTLKLAIEDTIQKHAPDVERIEAADAEPSTPGGPALIQLEPLAAPGGKGPDGAWITAGGLPQLRVDGTLLKEVGGSDMLFCRVSGQFYAYRPGCPRCGSSLEDATLRGGELTCVDCRHTYDVLRAGRCLDAPELYLEPIPLLADEGGVVRVALAEPA